MTPVYTAAGGVIFAAERRPVDLERAAAIQAVHALNAAHWLTRADLSERARKAMSEIERHLADEMGAAIAYAAQQQPMQVAA